MGWSLGVTRYDRAQIGLAVALSLLAGYIDGIGFLHLGGFFVSFMSGNSTRLAVGVSGDVSAHALLAGGLISIFVTGVVGGSLLGHAAGHWRRFVVLGAETVLLFAAAVLQATGYPVPAVIGMILAMGVENTVFQRDGEVSVGLTYMTGTLVKMGQRIAVALTGGSRWSWLRYFLLWAGLVAGGALGAIGYRAIGLDALWPAAAYSALIFATVCLQRHRLGQPEEKNMPALRPAS
jgi:uncharacterized membrane protein YoaK (UPF0700 family)